MGLRDSIDISKIMNYFDGINGVCKNIEPVFEDMDADNIVDLLGKAHELGESTWKLQADLIRLINDKSKRGQKAVEDVAKELGISRSYAFELYKISKELLSKDEELRNDQNLLIGHYSAVIRAFDKIKDPIAFLKKASDDNLTPTDLKKLIAGKKIDKKFELKYYKLSEEDAKNFKDKEWAVTKKISNAAYIMKDRNGNSYLELKIFND